MRRLRVLAPYSGSFVLSHNWRYQLRVQSCHDVFGWYRLFVLATVRFNGLLWFSRWNRLFWFCSGSICVYVVASKPGVVTAVVRSWFCGGSAKGPIERPPANKVMLSSWWSSHVNPPNGNQHEGKPYHLRRNFKAATSVLIVKRCCDSRHCPKISSPHPSR